MDQLRRLLMSIAGACALWACLWSAPAHAQSCAPATMQGTAPAGWETYCWLDFSTYNDVSARSIAGQNFAFTLSDGSILSFNLKATSTAATAAVSVAAPSWQSAAVGNSAFLGIPGRPILYMANHGSTVDFTINAITITPPSGTTAATTYAFVVADAEATAGSEQIVLSTNGGGWVELDRVNPISGTQYPTASGLGSATFTAAGGGLTGNVGAYIVGSTSPTQVTARMTGNGLEGIMFAIRFASIRLRKNITGARVDPSDQFDFRVTATSSGTTLASGTTSGTGNGPFNATPLSLASGLSLTLSESMAAGSVSSLSKYQGRLTCTNSTTGSTTPLPNNLLTRNYVFGTLQFGDAVVCVFNNAAIPHIRLRKALGLNGRYFATDQFAVRINQGATVVATATTTGTTTTVTGGDTGLVELVAGTAYSLNEIMAGQGSLTQYNAALSCTNAANGVTTNFPTTVPGNITSVLGDVVTCTITNSRIADDNATLVVTKTSAVLDDGVSVVNPKALPGARMRYTISVQNTGNLAVDANSIVITDVLPPNFTLDASTPMTLDLGNSGLAPFNQSTMVSYSSEASGGAPFTAPLGSGYNKAITGLRFQPSGIMAAATGAGPSIFSFSFVGRVD